MTVRLRYRSFIERHEVAWELTFAALAVVFVALAFVPIPAASQTERIVIALEWVITSIFIVEFTTRLWAAESRRQYLRGHWIDLVSCIPPVRWFRWFRLLRLLRLVRTFAGIGRALTSLERLSQHRGLIWLIIAWIGVMLLCAVGLFVSEYGLNNAIEGPLDALWWGLTTMTTVGYGDVFPVTAEGRLAAAVLMILGIGLYSIITATVTSVLIAGRTESDLPGQLAELARLHSVGSLTDAEFISAKAILVSPSAPPHGSVHAEDPSRDSSWEVGRSG